MEGALSAFKRAHNSAPNDAQPIVAIVRTYMRSGKSKEALAFIDSVLKDNPNNTEAQMIKGQIYLSAGNIQEAQQIFSSFVKANPKNASGYQQLAIAQKQASQPVEAEKTIQEGLKQLPNDLNLMLTQTELLVGANRIDDAIKLYEDILKQRPGLEIANNNLANLLLDYRTDQASFTRALTLAKDFKNSATPQFLDTFGWANYKLGKFDPAQKALESATEKSPEIAIFQYHLAKIYIAKNDTVSAKQALQKSIKLAENQPFSEKEKADAIALLKTL